MAKSSSGGLLLLVLGGAAVAALALKGSSAPASPAPPGGSGGINPGALIPGLPKAPGANTDIFSAIHNAAIAGAIPSLNVGPIAKLNLGLLTVQQSFLNNSPCPIETNIPASLQSQIVSALNGPNGSVSQGQINAVAAAGFPVAAQCLALKMAYDQSANTIQTEIMKSFYDGGTQNVPFTSPFACDTGQVPAALAASVGAPMAFAFTPVYSGDPPISSAPADALITRHTKGYAFIASVLDNAGLPQAATCIRAKSSANQTNYAFLQSKA